jgi:Lon protease-like protein
MENKVFLFPLQGSVLFRKVTLPYHIFEDRYRKMVKDSISKHIPIGIISHEDGEDYSGKVCIAGFPHILSNYPDGRMDVFITGEVKCRLQNFDSENPYKIYSYKSVDEDLILDETFDMELDSLRTLLRKWAIHFLPDPVQRDNFSSTLGDSELLINYCAVFLVNSFEAKRQVMKANSLKEKVKIIEKAIGPKEISLGPFMPPLKF